MKKTVKNKNKACKIVKTDNKFYPSKDAMNKTKNKVESCLEVNKSDIDNHGVVNEYFEKVDINKVKRLGTNLKKNLLKETDDLISKSDNAASPLKEIKIVDLKGTFTEKEIKSLKKKGLKNPTKKYNWPKQVMKDDSQYFNDMYHVKLSLKERRLLEKSLVDYVNKRSAVSENTEPVKEIKLTGIELKNPKKSKGKKAKLVKKACDCSSPVKVMTIEELLKKDKSRS